MQLVKDEFPKEDKEPVEIPTPMRPPDYMRIEDVAKVGCRKLCTKSVWHPISTNQSHVAPFQMPRGAVQSLVARRCETEVKYPVSGGALPEAAAADDEPTDRLALR